LQPSGKDGLARFQGQEAISNMLQQNLGRASTQGIYFYLSERERADFNNILQYLVFLSINRAARLVSYPDKYISYWIYGIKNPIFAASRRQWH
jgi:hypothetical protein